MIVQAGSTDVTTYFCLRDASDGTAMTGATITNMDLQYVRSGAAPSTKADATALAATDSAHADNKAIEIDATDQPGIYRVDWPDAAFAAGVREVILTVLYSGAFTEHLRVELSPAVDVQAVDGNATAAANLNSACDNYSATRGLSGTALPAAAADAAGGLPISDAGGLDIDAKLANTNEVTAARMGALTDWIDAGRLDTILDAIAADVAGLDGDAMRGTNGANTTVPDAAGTAAALHVTTDAAIAALNNLSQAEAGTACTGALNSYDPPTKTELDSAVAPLASAAAVAALNDLSSAEAGAACASALTSYDPPTKTEMDSALAPVAQAAALATVDTVVGAIKVVTDAIPDAGALTTIGTDTARLTAARAGALTDLIDGGRLDLLIDAIKAVTDAIPDAGALTSLINILEADYSIDTTATPWELVVKVKGTATELLRKQLFQADGSNVTSTDHLVGQHVNTATQ